MQHWEKVREDASDIVQTAKINVLLQLLIDKGTHCGKPAGIRAVPLCPLTLW